MWIRLLLIGILIYLVVNMVRRYLSGGQKTDINKESGRGKKDKGFPDDVGEYVDYEEVDDD